MSVRNKRSREQRGWNCRRAGFRVFPHAARALSLFLENIEMVASKATLRCYETIVASQVQRFHVALAEKVSPELAQVAQEFLATEH